MKASSIPEVRSSCNHTLQKAADTSDRIFQAGHFSDQKGNEVEHLKVPVCVVGCGRIGGGLAALNN